MGDSRAGSAVLFLNSGLGNRMLGAPIRFLPLRRPILLNRDSTGVALEFASVTTGGFSSERSAMTTLLIALGLIVVALMLSAGRERSDLGTTNGWR